MGLEFLFIFNALNYLASALNNNICFNKVRNCQNYMLSKNNNIFFCATLFVKKMGKKKP